MTPNLIRIVAAACLGAALVPAQHEHDVVVVRKARSTVKKKSDGSKKHALVLALVEKLTEDDLTAAQRKACKKQLLTLLGSADKHSVDALLEVRPIVTEDKRSVDALLEVRPIVTEVHKGHGDEVEVRVKLVEDAAKNVQKKAGKDVLRWRTNEAKEIARVVESKPRRVAIVRDLAVESGGDRDVFVELVEQDPKSKDKAKRKVKAKGKDLGERAARLRTRLRELPTLERVFEKSDGDERQMVIHYRTLEDAKKAHRDALKAHAEVLRVHEEAIKAHGHAAKAHSDAFRIRKPKGDSNKGVFMFDTRQGPKKTKSKNKASGGRNLFTFEVEGEEEIEGLEEHIAEAMKNIEGIGEVEFDVLFHDARGKQGKAKVRAKTSDEPVFGVVVQGKDKPSKGGLWVVGEGKADEKAVFEWVQARGREHAHEEHEHEEHAHEEHEHEEHAHEEHAHEEHEEIVIEEVEEIEELDENVEELTEMIEELREEMRELREMMQEIRQALRGHERTGAQEGRWRRVSGRRGEFVGPARVRQVRARRDR